MTDLINMLPRFYRKLNEMQQIQSTLQAELGLADTTIQDTLDQMSLNTATWGLELWEEQLALDTNASLSYAMRREIIRAKMLGQGTTTKKLVEGVAQSFSVGKVNVDEDNGIYTIKITFIGEKGIPKNLSALKRALGEILPAHLAIEYIFTNSSWGDLIPLSWEDLKSKVWEQVKLIEGDDIYEKNRQLRS